jgi:tRNA pseudouridine32 synthase/23S rRNA pseudouridine746 synthase
MLPQATVSLPEKDYASVLPDIKLKPPLPIRQGVSPSKQFLPAGNWPSMLAFLQQYFPEISVERWVARMHRGEVVDADGLPLAPEQAYRPGIQIYYYREVEEEAKIPFEEVILFRDEHLLVMDKPHFLPVTPTGRYLQETLLVRLKRKLALDYLTPIHRLDRETAGVILFSHNPASRGAYQTLFQERKISKIYEALAATTTAIKFPLNYQSRLVAGEPFFRMREVSGVPNAETTIEILEHRGELTLYRLRPVSGKKHQLRVHMAALGMPILNDVFYPELLPEKGENFAQPLQLLARAIAFKDPYTGMERYFESARNLA